jgi:hypothetical protein
VNCLSAQELILESLDSPLSEGQRRDLELHLSGCEQCQRFQEVQLALDQALAAHYVAAPLSAAFQTELKRKVRADRCRALWDWIPDLIHVGGGVLLTVGCVWLLPAPASLVLAAGFAFTVGSYLLQTLFGFWLEELEGL